MNSAMETNASHISGTSDPEGQWFTDGVQPFGHAVTDGDQEAVREQQVKRRFAELAVELQRPVMADGPVDQRNPGCQQQHQQHQVHAGQAGDDPERRDGTGEGGERRSRRRRPATARRRQQRRPGSNGQEVGPEQPAAVLALEASAVLRRGERTGEAGRRTRRGKHCVSCTKIRRSPFIPL